MKLLKKVVRWVNAFDLVFNLANPEERIKKGTDYFKLKKAIVANDGIAVPIAIDQHNNIIDGHRRVTIARELKIRVPALVYDTDGQSDFIMVQNTIKSLNGFQMLEMYLKGGIIIAKIGEHILYLKRLGGMVVLRQIHKKRKSPLSYSIAVQMVHKMIPEASDKFLFKVLKYALKYSAYDLKAGIRHGLTKKQMKVHINKSTAIDFTVE